MNEILKQCTGFEWDDVNSDKNWLSHQVGMSKCEQFFFNQPLIIAFEISH